MIFAYYALRDLEGYNLKVAIIGMGTAGVSTLNQLAKHKKFKKITVDIFDSVEDMGMGKPFQNDSDRLLINLPANQMSLSPDDTKDEVYFK
jgi:uncharacterized NAD(P)/FAD-binding protein YdhS